MSEGKKPSDQLLSTTEPLTDESGINYESRILHPATQTSTVGQTSDDIGSDNESDYNISGRIDDITLTERQIDRVFGVHNRGDQLTTEDFELPASILLDVTSVSGAAMPALHISDGVPDPQNIREAMASPFSPQLKEAIIRHLDQLCTNGTWDEAVSLPGVKVVSTRWVFKIKYIYRRELDKFKSRIVARGFTQRYGVNFSETYSRY